MEKSLKQFRSDMKLLGYRVKTRPLTMSTRIATVLQGNDEITSGNVFSREHLNMHRAVFEYINEHRVSDNGTKIIT